MLTRTLGRSGIQVSGLGMGCWAIGGPFTRGVNTVGWGQVDDNESIRALHRALDLGINFYDTSNVYGAGHSERLLGRAFKGRWDGIVLATKFGNVFEEATRQITGTDATPHGIRAQCEDSLRRLGIDVIDLYQFHLGGHDLDEAVAVRETLESLVAEGKIRAYGWSTDSPERARLFATGPQCAAIQQRLNIFDGNAETLAVCEEYNLASINRGPLAMGLLTGKFSPDSTIPADDVRHGWNLRDGLQAERLKQLEDLRAVLTSDGRTLAQGALGWLWARSDRTIPIPGFKTVAQVEENAGALRFGPLSTAQMHQIEQILGR